jgi:hypothetical protein
MMGMTKPRLSIVESQPIDITALIRREIQQRDWERVMIQGDRNPSIGWLERRGEDMAEVVVRDPSGLAVPVEPGLVPTGFDPSREKDAYALEAWAFNVMLECAGLEQPSEVAIGGALLDFRDLDRILQWAREQSERIGA